MSDITSLYEAIFKSRRIGEAFLLIIQDKDNFPTLNMIIDGKIKYEDLTSRRKEDAKITSFLLNKNLKKLAEETLRLLKHVGITKIRSLNDLIHVLLIAFIDSVIHGKIEVREKEVRIEPQIVFEQVKKHKSSVLTAVGKSKLKHTLSQQDAQVLKSVVMTLKRLNNKPLPSEQRIRILEEQLEKLLRLDQFNTVVQHYVQLIRGELDGLKAFLEGDE